MEILWHGQNCFSLKGKQVTVVTDPYDTKEVGLKLPSLKADVVTASHAHPHSHHIEAVSGTNADAKPRLIDWAGEYEVGGVAVVMIPAFHFAQTEGAAGEKRGENLIAVFEIDGIRVCHLGDLGHRLTSEMTELIGDIDILMIPIGGHDVIDGKKAHEVVEQIDPRVVIPMRYKVKGVTMEMDLPEIFAKEVGISTVVPRASFKVGARTELPSEHTEFIFLEPETV